MAEAQAQGVSQSFTTLPEEFTVLPAPELIIDYELPDPTKPCTLFDLKATLRNVGAGSARNVSLSSSQPRVVDNTSNSPFGFEIILSTVYNLGARRCIDLRSHPTDQDKANWPIRGYDDKGRPICTFGYPFKANGFDAQRQRHKWICHQTCLKGTTPAVTLDHVIYPPPECPFLAPDHPHGQVINVGQRFPDGSIRLVRDIPVDTPTFKRLYHRARNAVEGRNATLNSFDLKRLPVYGHLRGKATIFLADTWLNLATLARLVREATLTARSLST